MRMYDAQCCTHAAYAAVYMCPHTAICVWTLLCILQMAQYVQPMPQPVQYVGLSFTPPSPHVSTPPLPHLSLSLPLSLSLSPPPPLSLTLLLSLSVCMYHLPPSSRSLFLSLFICISYMFVF